MKSHNFSVLIAAAAALATASWSTHTAAETTLKVSTCLQKTHDAMESYFEGFHEPINARDTGLKLEYLGGPEITPRQKQGAALKRGLIDIIMCPAPYYGDVITEARLIGAQNKSFEEIRDNGGFAMLQEAWGKGLNARILTWGAFDAQEFVIYTAFEPKQSTETGLDLNGRKMRSTGLYNPLFKAMNATPVTISASDVYSALERGVVDGLAFPRGSVSKYGWEKFLKHKIEPGFYSATYMVTINLDTYNELSEAHKKLLDEQGRNYQQKIDAILEKKYAVDDRKLKEAGVKTIELTGAVRDAYLATIYGAKWVENDKLDYSVDYETIKAKLYSSPGS